ncbi:hypothetical protein TNCV_2493901 [Trichonephila clavipes]|uniref:Uncharacterized protein n=1 Tax=Trichonephila clavipes TaxID=2585209 RepID=A0A8X6VAP2_TRICX|nr:hypothetical protein TNCV_2493901 [Trichonephila clavipes]
MIWLGSAPVSRENILGVVRSSHLSSPSTNLKREHATRQLFRVLLCRKGTLHLQTSMPSPRFEPSPTAQQSASLTALP